MARRQFELTDGKSEKFWEINQRGKKITVRFGRIGTKGQEKDKEYQSAADAKKAAESLIAQKLKKGYVEVGADSDKKPRAQSGSKPAKMKPSKSTPQITSTESIPKGETLTFVGLVAPSGGGGGGQSGGETLWTFHADLVAWKAGSGPLVRERLDVMVDKVDERKLHRLMGQFGNWKLVRFRARRPKRETRKFVTVEVTRFLGETRDEDLKQVKTELEASIEFHDRTFGTIRYSREHEYFDGKVKHQGQDIGLWFDTKSIEEAKTMVRLAKPLWRSRASWFKEFQALVLKEMLDQCREWWEPEELTEKRFLELLGDPCLITFRLDEGELTYQLGGWSEELFSDHGIDVNGTLKDGLVEVY